MAKVTSDKLSKAVKQKKSAKDEVVKKPAQVVVEAAEKPTKTRAKPTPAPAPPKEKKAKEEKSKAVAAPAAPASPVIPTVDKTKKRKKADSVSEPAPAAPAQKTKASKPAPADTEEEAPKKKAKKAAAPEPIKAEVEKPAEKPKPTKPTTADKKGKKAAEKQPEPAVKAASEKKGKKREEVEESEAEQAESSKRKAKGKAPAKVAEPKAVVKVADKKVEVKPATKAAPPAKKTKITAKAPSPSPSAASQSEAQEEGEGSAAEEDKSDEEDEDEGHLYGFSTDDEGDSSDEEVSGDWEGIDVSKLPTIAKDDAVIKKKLEKAKKQPTEDRGVIYLGRLPHGFYEDQMRAYFTQFGEVTRLRLSRNKKTGQSKHYAFIEFDSSAVAKIVAETMDNYLLLGHILRCKMIPKDEVHPELWVGANRKWRKVPRDRVARVQHNKPRTKEEQEKAEKRLLGRQEQKKRKLEEAGIKYDFEAVAYKKKAKSAEA
ncbi:hypothetical protein CERSUDRAFT_141366 [Gelatoporia subvermispora B]|uniref:RRM domain-containing protein n=1 Tax=Ceriporiopsis subvermispora (strain B) TaxID=914234 RepID=M2R509_CERS8|nr:hypothetical protein CERSUDRAFT_141366 [Gelatoporia subvermispora B]